MSDTTAVPQLDGAHWQRSLLLLGGLIVLLILAQWPVSSDLVSVWWRSKTFNHCVLIPIISLWLVYERKKELATLAPQPSNWGFVLLAFAALLLIAGELAGVAVLGHFALVLSVQALIWTVLGSDVCRRLLFPLLYLWFAVPFGDFLVPKLQDITADMAVALLRLFDIPVFRDGHFIALPNGNFLVEEACSGINYLIASLALGTLYAYLQYRSYYRRAVFIGLSIVVPVIANGLRAFGIILTAHLTDNEYAVGVDHLIYGWIFFGIVMFLLFLLGRTFADGGPTSSAATATAASAATRPHTALTLLCLALIAGPGIIARQDSITAATELPAVPTLANWQIAPADPLGTELIGARQLLLLQQGEIQIVAGYFPQDKRGSELVNSYHRLYDGERWRRLENDVRPVLGVSAAGLRLNDRSGDTLLQHSLYVFADGHYGPAWQAKWHQLQARLRQQSAPALLLLVLRPATLPDSELDQQLAGLLPVLQQQLEQARSTAP